MVLYCVGDLDQHWSSLDISSLLSSAVISVDCYVCSTQVLSRKYVGWLRVLNVNHLSTSQPVKTHALFSHNSVTCCLVNTFVINPSSIMNPLLGIIIMSKRQCDLIHFHCLSLRSGDRGWVRLGWGGGRGWGSWVGWGGVVGYCACPKLILHSLLIDVYISYAVPSAHQH